MVNISVYNYTCYHILTSHSQQHNISSTSWLLTLQHLQHFLKLLDANICLFCISHFYTCLFYVSLFYLFLFHFYLFIFAGFTYSVILILMQFCLYNPILSPMLFLHIQSTCYCIELNY